MDGGRLCEGGTWLCSGTVGAPEITFNKSHVNRTKTSRDIFMFSSLQTTSSAHSRAQSTSHNVPVCRLLRTVVGL